MEDIRVGDFAGPVVAVLLAVSIPSGSAYGAAAAPDLAGIYWATEYNAKVQIVGGGDLPLSSAGKAAYDRNIAGLKDGSVIDAARRYCVPDGLPRVLATPYPFEIIQAPPGQVTIIYELNHQVRAIRMGKPMPGAKALLTFPSYNGYSVGRFEGDTLVVETAGFNGKNWLDEMGHPLSESMHLTERYQRRDFGHMDVEMTFDDAKYYTRPFTVRLPMRLMEGSDVFEDICGENEKDRAHLDP